MMRRAGGVKTGRQESDVEAEMDDVAVLHGIVLAFEAELARLAAFGVAAVADEVVVGHNFGADEAALDVAVDLSGGLARRRPLPDRPRLDLVFPGGEEAHDA